MNADTHDNVAHDYVAHDYVIMQFQQGDEHAFGLIFEQYRVPVFNFIYRMLNGDRTSAEDLLNEVFMKLHDAREDYEPKAKFSTWLFTIARNHCLNCIKSRNYRQSRRTVSLEELAQKTTESSAPNRLVSRSVPDDAKRADLRELLEQAIAGLPDEYKEVFILHAVEGFAHAEVAQMLKTNPATVRTHYHRARALLREQIATSG